MSVAPVVGAAIKTAALGLERRARSISTRTVSVDGFAVTYDEARPFDKEVVLLLHGFSADRDVWLRFASQLGGRRVVVPDLPGHGHTPFRRGAGYSAPEQALRMVALLDQLGIERAHVIGNSMGGFIAAWMAVLAPSRVTTLGLVDAAGVISPVASEHDGVVARGGNAFLIHDRAGFEGFYPLTMAKPPFVPGIVRAAVAADYVARRDQLAEIFRDFHHQNLLDDRLGEISAPTWICWGALDRLVHRSAADVWSAGIDRSSVTLYDDLGHMPMFEDPRRSARDYMAFLDTTRPNFES